MSRNLDDIIPHKSAIQLMLTINNEKPNGISRYDEVGYILK
jgi:hypothetical protein